MTFRAPPCIHTHTHTHAHDEASSGFSQLYDRILKKIYSYNTYLLTYEQGIFNLYLNTIFNPIFAFAF